MAEELGGRILTKNTRAGRLERQQRASSVSTEFAASTSGDMSDTIDPDPESSIIDGDEDPEGDAAVHIDTDDTLHEELNGELAFAVKLAYRSVFDTVAADLGVSDNEYSYVSSLLFDRAIPAALNGGANHDRVDGIDERVRYHVRAQAQVNIQTYEALLRVSDDEDGT